MKTNLIIYLITIFLTFSCSSQKTENPGQEKETHGPEGVVVLNEQQRNALKLETGTFQMRNITSVVKTNGQLEVPPASSADVTTVIGGNVKEILVFDGDRVRKGEKLAVLEHPDYITLQEDFSATANRLEFLGKEYLRQKELFENNVGAGKDYQQAKADYNTAKARYEGLKSRLELLNIDPGKVSEGVITKTISIVAPIQGYVNDVNIKMGTYADAKDKLFSITDNSSIHADFMVYENDVYMLKNGQKIDFTVANRPGEELTGTIFAIGSEFEPNTRAVHVHASLDSNPGNLIPGMYISGHIHTGNNLTNTLPAEALVSEGTKTYIFVEDPEAIQNADSNLTAYRMVEVITGISEGGYTEVRLLDDLPENTRVVMNAAYYLLADLKKEETEHED